MANGFHKFLRVSAKVLLLLVILIVVFVIYFKSVTRLQEPVITDRSSEQCLMELQTPEFKKVGHCWLKKSQSGLWELYVEGDAFERGVMNGKLTQELAEFQETVFVNQIRQLVPSERYLKWLNYFISYFNRDLSDNISEEYKKEIYGVSLYASDKFDNEASKYYRILNYHSAHDIGHALQDKNMTVGCTSFGVWGDKTTDGKLLIGRNFDFFAGDDFATNKIVCFTQPATGHKFMYVTWAGFTGVVSGMNDKGLTVTLNAAKSEIPTSAATPISLLAKEILQYASTIDEALAIAKKRNTFVSESILIGSAIDKRAAVIEKTPIITSLYNEQDNQLVCSNHFKSTAFAKDYINGKNILESSSLYRDARTKQLLGRVKKLTAEDAAAILRNQDGINDKAIGLSNEKGLNQLIAHHSIIFKPEEQLVWISCSPYQLGKYVCYDLKKVFNEAPSIAENRELVEEDKTISKDPFVTSPLYQNFLLYKQLSKYIQFCASSPYSLKVSDKHLALFEKVNPDFYDTYRILGDYYEKTGESDLSVNYYKKALTKEVATKKEADQLKEKIARYTTQHIK